MARIVFLEVRTADDWTLSFAAERYDPTDLLRAFDDREVPERDFIRKVFMPFPSASRVDFASRRSTHE